MAWQQMVLEVALELLADGTLAYREVIVTVERQQGKTTLVLGVSVHRAAFWKRRTRTYYSAQTGQDGRQKVTDDWVPVIEASPLAEHVKVRRGTDQVSLTYPNGSRLDVMASSEHSGHGKVVDLAIIDEAFSDVDDRREQAMIPAMMTRPDAQLWVVSTAGTEASAYLKRKVDAGRAAVAEGLDRGLCYFEWSAEPDAPIDDPATWRSCMPALGVMVPESTVASALRTMPEGEFRRAFLNQWTIGDEAVIPSSTWNAVCNAGVEADRATSCLGLDVTPDRSSASIVACDGSSRAEVVDVRPGVAWVVGRVSELAARYGSPVAVDLRGPAASLVDELEAAGVNLQKYAAAEMAGATARLYDAIADRKLSIRSHDALNRAREGARKRVSGDQWYWARSGSNIDISPLVALTLAYDCAISTNREQALWAWSPGDP